MYFTIHYSPAAFEPKMAAAATLTTTQIRTCVLYDYRLGVSAAESHRRLCQAFGAEVVGRRTVYNWYQRFESGDFCVEDKTHTGRPAELDNDALRSLVEANPKVTVRELAAHFDKSISTIDSHLRALGKVSKLDMWIPHELSPVQRDQRAECCSQLLSYRRTHAWLDSIITGDEKWVVYVNTTRKRQWLDKGTTPGGTPKPDLHERKVMLSIWWDVKGVVYYELLPHNTTITADIYCNQLQQLATQLATKRPQHGQVRFLHDNARPHTARITREKLLQLGWEILPHPPYSPDLAPSDYHLFRSLQDFLRDKRYDSEEDIKTDLDGFFSSKPEEFYRKGIYDLPTRWQQVMASNGEYIID